MATSLDTLSLSQLLDLAIGMPQKGTVHFAAMRKLLQAMLGHLDVQYLTTEEPWTGQLSGPTLADLATAMEQMKNEIENNKKEMTEALHEEIDALKAEHSHMSQEIKNIQEEQAMTVSKAIEEIETLKDAQFNMTDDMHKIQTSRDEDMAVTEELRMEIERIKATHSRMEGEIEQAKKTLGFMKKLEEDIQKLREDLAKWKEESSKEMSQRLEALLQEMKQELQKLKEHQEMRNAMLQQLITETADQLNEQDEELRRQMEDKFSEIQKDCEKLSFITGNLQKDSQQKQKAIQMLFQSLEKLQKEKADEQDMLAAMDVKADKAALGSKLDCSHFEENMEKLDERFQELQSQISGQKQHWNKVQQQFSDAMEEKLDRLELKVFRKKLEASWSRSMEELEKKVTEDSAAGTKKQLPVPFTCLSCDRMLTMQVPGQYPETLPYLQPLPPSKEPQHRQRRTEAHGSIPRVPQSCGDYQSSRSMMQHIQASPQTSARIQRFLALHNKPRVTQLLGSGGHISSGRDDQRPVVIWTRDEPGPASSWEHQPGTASQYISWAARLPQPLQPRQTSTAPK